MALRPCRTTWPTRPGSEPASRKLSEAAGLSDDAGFAKYLGLLSKALTTDDYYEADSAWLDLDAPKIDLVFAPYETYLDDLLGVKTSYGAAVMVRNEPESRKLDLFRKYVAQIQDALPLPPEDRPSLAGKAAPMEVMDTPFRAGDLRHGYQAVGRQPAERPAHPRGEGIEAHVLQELHGRPRQRSRPPRRAPRRWCPELARLASAEGYLTDTLMHEICHGLGPAYARRRTAGACRHPRSRSARSSRAVEEAKADMTGMFGLDWLVTKGVLAEGAARRVPGVLSRRHLPDRALRHRGGAWPRAR